jgi:hypothetical protein
MIGVRALVLLMAWGLAAPRGCLAEDALPPPLARPVDFVADVRPLLARHCHTCHGADLQEGGLRLDQQAAAMTGGMFVIALDVSRFTPLEEFRGRVAELAAHVKTCPPAAGFQAIHVPGELESQTRTARLRDGIPIEPGSWELIAAVARRFVVDVPAAIQP